MGWAPAVLGGWEGVLATASNKLASLTLSLCVLQARIAEVNQGLQDAQQRIEDVHLEAEEVGPRCLISIWC